MLFSDQLLTQQRLSHRAILKEHLDGGAHKCYYNAKHEGSEVNSRGENLKLATDGTSV